MSAEDIQRWRELADNATPGPWNEDGPIWTEDDAPKCFGLITGEDREPVTGAVWDENDRKFIAAARSAVPELCDMVEALQAERDNAWHAGYVKGRQDYHDESARWRNGALGVE